LEYKRLERGGKKLDRGGRGCLTPQIFVSLGVRIEPIREGTWCRDERAKRGGGGGEKGGGTSAQQK